MVLKHEYYLDLDKVYKYTFKNFMLLFMAIPFAVESGVMERCVAICVLTVRTH